MSDRAFVYTFTTRVGTFRIQAHKERYALFIDYPQGDYDLLTSCVSVDDGIDYVEHQDTGYPDWDNLPSDQVPEKIRYVEHWQRRPLRPQPTTNQHTNMQIDGAVIREQGQVFGIVIVNQSAMMSDSAAAECRAAFQGLFPGMPLILACQDSRGVFEYQGRRDIVDFLASIDASRIPWKRYTVS